MGRSTDHRSIGLGSRHRNSFVIEMGLWQRRLDPAASDQDGGKLVYASRSGRAGPRTRQDRSTPILRSLLSTMPSVATRVDTRVPSSLKRNTRPAGAPRASPATSTRHDQPGRTLALSEPLLRHRRRPLLHSAAPPRFKSVRPRIHAPNVFKTLGASGPSLWKKPRRSHLRMPGTGVTPTRK